MRTANTRLYCPVRTVSYGRPSGVRVRQRGETTPAASPCRPSAPIVKQQTSPVTPVTTQPSVAPKKTTNHPVKAAMPAKSAIKKEVFMPPLVHNAKKDSTAPAVRARRVMSPQQQKAQMTAQRATSTPKRRALARPSRRLARSARLLMALEKKAAVTKKPPRLQLKVMRSAARSMKRAGLWRPSVVQVAAVAVLLVSGYVAADAWLVNRQVRQDLQETVAAAQGDYDGNARQAAEGKDETPISANAIANYRVAADLPRMVMIDKISARARVLPMGVNNDGSMQAPLNAFDAGWYTGAVKPGQRGASVIIAHEFGPTQAGLFHKLNTLQNGDIVKVERGDGSVLQYQVVATKTASLQDVDMNEFIRPAQGVDEGLNLMSCTGQWVRGENTRSHRVMVFTKRI